LSYGSPEDVRGFINARRDELSIGGHSLAGCLLVGDIPAAWYEMLTEWDPGVFTPEEFPIDLFYMDLDGTWTDADTDGLYDDHTGDVAPEIWIGRIKADDMAEPEDELIENYFDKNHAYRTGSLSLPHRALEYVDEDWAGGGTIWDPSLENAYSSVTLVEDASTNAANYQAQLTTVGGWSFVHLMCHGSPARHTFKVPDPGPPPAMVWDGRFYGYHTTPLPADTYSYEIEDPLVFFYNLFVCSGARFTETNYLAGWCIFTDTYGLAAVASTKTGSMRAFSTFYTTLGNGFTMGTAFQNWFATHGESSRPWYYGMAFIGDPTLRVSGTYLMHINTPGLTAANDVVHFYDGGWDTGDVSGGTWSDYCDHGTTLSIDGVITVSGTEQYSTTDTHSWKVAEPRTFTVNYHRQYKPTISTSGLPASHPATVSYVQNGASLTKEIYDGHPFNEWCDTGSTLSVENPVMASAGERYYSTDTTAWTVNSAFSATVSYTRQFEVTCSVTTAGAGHTDLDAGNHVTVEYEKSGSSLSEDIHDTHSLKSWMDAGTHYTFENPSSSSTGTHRWFTPEPTSYTVTSPTTTSLTYYEQYWRTIQSTGGLLTSTYHGTASYEQFGAPKTGIYYDGSQWSDWCNVGSTLAASQIVLGPPNIRYHTPGTVEWTVTSSDTNVLPYHEEYKVTIEAGGLPDSLSTTVTIGTADPSPSDGVAGGDIDDYVLTLDVGNSFTWTNWVHADTDLTALDLITVSPSEKYVLVFWTKNCVKLPPDTIYADTEGLTYSAQYAGIKKEMTPDEGTICQSMTVKIEVSNPPAGAPEDSVGIIDDLPNELSFVKGSAEIDGAPYAPTLSEQPGPDPYERLEFTVNGEGKHEITFETKINRAYATDTIVENHVDATFFIDTWEVPLDVLFEVTIHPYIGPTLSVVADGPEIVPLFTKESWVFTYIVKNNYDYVMTGSILKDNYGAELIQDEDTVIANLLTEWDFPITKGKMGKVRLSWMLPNLDPGEAFKFEVTMSTDFNAAKDPKQEYTSPGVKFLNSGATLKWYDDAEKKHSLEADPISVTACE